jgi:23S rRNA pseudouridine2605 synthase
MNTRKSGSRGNDSNKKTFKGKKGAPGKPVGNKDTNKKTFKGRKGAEGKPVGDKEVKARDKRKYIDYKEKVKKGDPLPSFNDDAIRLNKYLSNAGVSSRREADLLIKTGLVSVNGEIITEMGYKIKPGDEVKYDGGSIKAERKQYVLLNKPKGFITTMDDPMGRKTVMSLVKKACKERVYPVGRLDRDTTGLLLFTNDGDLAKKLTHPKHKASKLYHVELNKKVNPGDLQKMLSGVELEDGTTRFDKAEYASEDDAKQVGVELHSGKNRIVRRTFEALGYTVVKLDRVMFAGLTKRDLPRGMYRLLSEKEVSFLRMK